MSPIAARRYSAGRIFLDVVPSFRGVVREIRQEARKVRDQVAKDDVEAAEKTAERMADAAVKGQQRAEDERTKTARKGVQDRNKLFAKGLEQLERDQIKARAREEAARKRAAEKEAAEQRKQLDQLGRDWAKAAKERADTERRTAQTLWNIRMDTLRKQWAEEAKQRQQEERDRIKAEATADRERTRQRSIRERWAMQQREKEANRQAKLELKRAREHGGRFGQEFREAINKALLDIAPATLDVDATPAHRELGMIAQRLRQLHDAEIGVDIDARQAVRELRSIERQAERLDRRGITLDVRTNAKSTTALLRDYRKELANVTKASGVLADRHARGRERALDAANAFRLFNGVVVAAALFVPMLIPAIAGLAAALGGLIPLLTAAGAGLGGALIGFIGIGDAVKALSDVNKNAAKDSLAATKTMRNAARSVRDAEQGLAQARVAAGRASRDAARRVADAEEALADAREQATRRAEDAARRVADARRAQVDAERRAAEQIESALRRQEDAERNLERAQLSALEAQERLLDARKRAQEQLEDLQSRVAAGKLAEREAELALRDAERRMTITARDPNSTTTDRERAEINLERAKLDLADLRRENKRLLDEQREANEKGVEGADDVVDARERIKETLEAEQEAQRDLQSAAEDLAQTRIDAARDIADAEQAVSDALRDQRDVAKENARSIRDAQRALADAQQAQRETAVDNARAIRDASERLVDAQAAYQEALQQTAEIGSSSMQKLKEAMDNLSPAGQRFARQLYSLAPLWDRLRFASQEAMLPGAGRALDIITQPRVVTGVEGFVSKTAGAAGGIMERAATDLTGPDWAPFFQMLNRVAVPAMEIFAKIGRNLALTLANLGVAFEDFGLSLGQGLVDLTQSWVDWSRNLKDSEGFQQFMDYAERVGPKVLDLLVALGNALITIGIGMAPYAEVLVDAFTSIFNWIAEQDPKVVGMIVTALIGLVLAIQVAAGAMSTFSTISMFFSKNKAGAFANPLALWALAIMGVVAAIALLVAYFPGLVDWLKENWKWVALVVGTMVAAYAAYRTFIYLQGLYATVLFLVRSGLMGVYVAQLLAFGKVLAIIALIGALVAALVWLYNNNETFRTIVQAVWTAVQQAIAAVVDWAVNVAWPALVAGWNWIVDAISAGVDWLVTNVWPHLVAGWQAAVEVFQYVWTNWLQPILSDLWEMAQKVFGWIADNILPHMMRSFDIMATAWRITWKNVIWPVLQALWGFAVDLWENGLQPVFGFIGGALKVLGDFFTDFWQNGVKPALEGVGNVISWVWENVIEPVFEALQRGIHAIEDAFDSGMGFIETIWAGITSAIGGPVRAVLTWIKEHFVDPLNSLLSKIGISWQIPFFDIPNVLRYVPPTKGNVNRGQRSGGGRQINKSYANTGGIWGALPGYNPGFDNLKFTSPLGELHLSGGEAIMRPEVTRVLGKRTIDEMNGAARAGGEAGVARKLMGFANGGTVDYKKLPQLELDTKGHDIPAEPDRGFWGNLWHGVMGALENVGEFISDPIGKMQEIVTGILDFLPFKNFLPGEFMLGVFKNIASSAAEKVKEFFSGAGPEGMAGGPRSDGGGMGFAQQIQVVKSLFPGIGVSDSLRPPNTLTASGFLSYHSRARAVDFVGSRSQMEALYNWLVATYGNSSPEIYFGPGGWATRYGKKVFLSGITAATHPFNHVHWAHALGGIFNPFGGDAGVYDQGGMLGPRDMAINLGNRPEAVLTPDQSDALQRAAEFGFGGNGGVTYAPQLTSVNGASAEEVLEEFDWATRRLERDYRHGRRP